MAPRTYRSQLRVGAAAILTLALLAACSTSKKASGVGGLTAASNPSASAGPLPGASAGATATSATTATPPPTSKPKKSGQTPPPPPPASPVTVTAAVNTEGGVITSVCPHHFMVAGTITVSGPADVTYQWLRDGTTRSDPQTLHFTGTGSQTMPVADDDAEIRAAASLSDTIVLTSPVQLTATPTTFELECTASASRPIASATVLYCPHAVVFRSTLSVPIGGQGASYTWHFSDGTASSGSYAFGASETSHPIAISKNVVSGSISAYITVTNGAGMTTPTTISRCPIKLPDE